MMLTNKMYVLPNFCLQLVFVVRTQPYDYRSLLWCGQYCTRMGKWDRHSSHSHGSSGSWNSDKENWKGGYGGNARDRSWNASRPSQRSYSSASEDYSRKRRGDSGGWVNQRNILSAGAVFGTAAAAYSHSKRKKDGISSLLLEIVTDSASWLLKTVVSR